MPIRPENRARYPKDWKAISLRIRKERAGDRCERCKAPNGQCVIRGAGVHTGFYMLERGEVFNADTGEYAGMARGSEFLGPMVKIVLTVAHLDHRPENSADDNLMALCQRCHLRHDAKHHVATARATRRSRLASADLFAHTTVPQEG